MSLLRPVGSVLHLRRLQPANLVTWRFQRLRTAALPGSHPSVRWRSSTTSPTTSSLTWPELYTASRLAKWSGLTYYPADVLPEHLESQGLTLVAQGVTPYTQWFIADGSIDYEPPMSSALRSLGADAASGSAASPANNHSVSNHSHSAATAPLSSPSSSSSSSSPPSAAAASGAARGEVKTGQAGNASQQGPGTSGLGMSIPSQRRRFVFVRGVSWSSPTLSSSVVNRALFNFLPAPFSPSLTHPQDALMSHAGITDLARDLYDQILPHLNAPESHASGTGTASSSTSQGNTSQGVSSSSSSSRSSSTSSSSSSSGSHSHSRGHAGAAATSQQPGNSVQSPLASSSTTSPASSSTTSPAAAAPQSGAPLPVWFAGHSMGGALCLLMAAMCALAKHRPPSDIHVHQFGSPPVLAHKDGGGGHKVLEALGLPGHAVRSFVLENDPVPRALLTVDPTFNMIKSFTPVRQLLEVRSRLAESGLLNLLTSSVPSVGAVPAMSASRFLYEMVGSCYLMKGGSEIIPISTAADVEELLRMAVSDVTTRPVQAIKALLDHHHASYAHDLEIAALAKLKRELRAARKARMQQQASKPGQQQQELQPQQVAAQAQEQQQQQSVSQEHELLRQQAKEDAQHSIGQHLQQTIGQLQQQRQGSTNGAEAALRPDAIPAIPAINYHVV